MEAKIYLLCLLPTLFVAYSDALKCHVCDYVKSDLDGTSSEVGEDCKDVDDMETSSCNTACTTMDFTVKGDAAGLDFDIKYLIRGCADNLEGRDSDKCYDIDEFFTAQELEDEIERQFPVLGSVITIDSAEGDACLCDDDKCNSASSFTAGVVIVFATLVGYLMKN